MSDQNTKGRLSIKENGDANSYALLDESGKWLLSILHNGEKLTSVQRETMRRVAACWNACEGISTEDLTDIARTGGMLGPRDDIAQIAKQRDGLANALSELLSDVDGLMGESTGVYGLHMNGDVSPWSELEEGGRFERLPSMSKARAAIARYSGEKP